MYKKGIFSEVQRWKKFSTLFQILHIKSAWFLLELAMALVTTIGMKFLQVCFNIKIIYLGFSGSHHGSLISSFILSVWKANQFWLQCCNKFDLKQVQKWGGALIHCAQRRPYLGKPICFSNQNSKPKFRPEFWPEFRLEMGRSANFIAHI